jgi:uncharacterized protein YkvS
MNFELEYLWNLFTEQSVKQPSVKQCQDLEKEIVAEMERLKRVFLFFSPQHGVTIEAFIQFHQHSISRLILAIENQLQSSDNTKEISIFNSRLLDNLNGLIDFLQLNYPSEFDFSAPISATCLQKEKIRQEANVQPIRNAFDNRPIDNNLRSILIATLNFSDREMVTYADISYVVSISSSILKKVESIDSDKDLMDLLIAHNYNNLRFFDFFKQHMDTEFERALEISEKYKTLLIYKKEIEQTIPESSGQYSLSHPSLSQLIIKHLEFERLFLKELDLATTEWVNSGLLDANYKVSLTVKQLAFYVYLNVECGIITEQRAKKIHQYVISHVDSHEKSGISEKSFKNAYYLHHAEDIRKVIDKIAKMLAIARERF